MFAYSALSRLYLWFSEEPRQVVEAVRRAQVRDRRAGHRLRDAVDEPPQLLEQLRVQSPAGPPTTAAAEYMRAYQLTWFSRSAGQRQNEPCGGRDDPVGDQVAVDAEHVPRAPRDRQRPGDLGVHDQVLDAAAVQPVAPARHVALRARGRLRHPRRPVAQRVDQRPRPVVAPRRAGVPRQRRRRVREQHVRVEHRARRAGTESPSQYWSSDVLHAVRERPVGGVVGERGGRGGGRARGTHGRAAAGSASSALEPSTKPRRVDGATGMGGALLCLVFRAAGGAGYGAELQPLRRRRVVLTR